MKRILPALLTILAAACASGGSRRPVPPDVIPVTAAPVPDSSRVPEGEARASVGFGRVLPDAEVVALAERYGLRPYEVWLMVGEAPAAFEVPTGRPLAQALAEARRVRAESARQVPCAWLTRLDARAASGRGSRPAPGDRDPGGRMMLSRIEAARAGPERLLRGEPAVHGLRVAATAEALRAAAADPRVRSVAPRMADGHVPSPPPPEGHDPVGRSILPEVDAMETEEVRRRLDRYAAEGLPECREHMRNAVMDEATVRVDPGAVVDGVAFHVQTVVDSIRPRREFPGTGPTTVQAILTLENRTGGPLEVPVRGCTEGVRIYRDSARTVLAAPAAHPGARCMQDPHVLTLAPGERRQAETLLEADRVLSDSLRPGRYWLSATYRLRDRTVELPAGEVVLRSGLEPLRYPVRLTVRGDSLRVRMSVVNASREPVTLEYGDCALHLRAYRSADRSGGPVWRSELRGPIDGGPIHAYACTAVGHGVTLAPGEAVHRGFELGVPIIEVLGDSLPDGRYWFTAYIELNFDQTPEVPAGDAVLAAQRPPLAATRQSGVMRFTADTWVADGAVVAEVTGTLTGASSAIQRLSESCPVVLYAYRTRADRDAASLASAPAWTSHRDCPPRTLEHTMYGSERYTWRVRASAAEILDAGLPPGRYFFAVAVNHEDRRVVLAAGEGVVGR